MLIKKPDTNGLMTTIVLNTKISEVEKKVPDSSSLVTTTVLNTKLVKLRIQFLTIVNILLILNLIS